MLLQPGQHLREPGSREELTRVRRERTGPKSVGFGEVARGGMAWKPEGLTLR